MFMLQTSETALAKFPELPQAKSVVNSTTSWMSVSFADEPPSEIQPAQTYRSTGEIHTHQQAWLQLVRIQINMKTHKIKFKLFLSFFTALPFSHLPTSTLGVGYVRPPHHKAVAFQSSKFPVPCY